MNRILRHYLLLPLLAAIPTLAAADPSVPSSEEIDQAIVQAAHLYRVDPNLMRAIALVESQNNPYVIGDNGRAFGLFQINYWVRKYDIPPEQMFDVRRNAMWGAFALSECRKSYPYDFWMTVGCFNVGADGKPYRAAVNYAWRVHRALQKVMLERH